MSARKSMAPPAQASTAVPVVHTQSRSRPARSVDPRGQPRKRSRAGNPLYEARFVQCGMTVKEAARFLGISVRTIRWHESGASNGVPTYMLRALWMRAGFLGIVHPDWKGWRLGHDGCLYPPGSKWGFLPSELQAIPILYQHLESLKERVSDLENGGAEFAIENL
jgi:hypothetical protein